MVGGTGNIPYKTYGSYTTFVEWGNNKIGVDAPNTWRTLSKEEWIYIFCIRTNAQKLFAFGSVDGIRGLIILPDDWNIAFNGVSFIPSMQKGLEQSGNQYTNWVDVLHRSFHNHWLDNSYTLVDWQEMEKAGAIFLPAAGNRYGKRIEGVQFFGNYWSNKVYGNNYANSLSFTNDVINPQCDGNTSTGYSVRLVKDL